MTPSPLPFLVLLIAAVAGWAEQAHAGQIDVAAARVKHPGIVLVDPPARAAELQRLDPAERTRLCPPAALDTEPAPVIRLVGPTTSSGADPAAQPFTLAVMAGAAATLAGDRGADAATRALIGRWAQADALSDLVEAGPDRNNVNTLYSLKRVLLGLIPAWAVVAEHAEAAERRAVTDWIARRVADADMPTGPAASRASESTPGNHNNNRLMREAVVMAHGALIGDDTRFRRGIQFFLATLRDMRPDGSLPLETARGARALWYQRHAVASLVFIAELARAQGQDLYAADVDGKRLTRAVEFLLTEIAEPRRLAAYAAERQDLGFLETRPSGRNAMAWLEPWHRRSPPSWTGGALATGDIVTTTLAHRPLIDELSGGNLTCLFAKLN
jgi:poly(beta-D-mannuronate) lyase